MRKILILIMFSLLLTSIAVQAELRVVLEESKSENFTIYPREYNVMVVSVFEDKVLFRVNGEEIPEIKKAVKVLATEHLVITIQKIETNESGNTFVDFTMEDRLNLHPGNEPDDCEQGEINIRDNCVLAFLEAECGDNKCYSEETCEIDKCCNGTKVSDFTRDNNHCGGCFNQCQDNKTCMSGECYCYNKAKVCNICHEGEEGDLCDCNEECKSNVCKGLCQGSGPICGNELCDGNENCETCPDDCGCEEPEACIDQSCTTCGNGVCENAEIGSCKKDCAWCGDGLCEKDEEGICDEDCGVCGDGTCSPNEDCCLDCGCENGLTCINNLCVEQGDCKSNIDCDDNNACTTDYCSGNPKKCSYKQKKGCEFEDKCLKYGVIREPNYCSEDKTWKPLKEKGAECSEDYECLTEECKDATCYSPGLFSSILLWFSNLFGR